MGVLLLAGRDTDPLASQTIVYQNEEGLNSVRIFAPSVEKKGAVPAATPQVCNSSPSAKEVVAGGNWWFLPRSRLRVCASVLKPPISWKMDRYRLICPITTPIT